MKLSLKYRKSEILAEVHFETARGGGKGGQHVNKVETKVDVLFNIEYSKLFNYNQKERLLRGLNNRINSGVLRLSCHESRSQSRNKEIVLDRLIDLLDDALKVQKKRIPIKISKRKKKERMDNKRIQKNKKILRRKPTREED